MPSRRHEDGDGHASTVDALRRRLYRAGASAEDVARYRALLAAQPGPHPTEPRTAGRPSARRALAARAAVLALIGGLALAALTLRAPGPRGEAVTTPAPRRPAPSAVALAVPASARTAFVSRLEAGRGAGVADWFEDHPESRPAQVTTLSRAATEEHHGTGSAEVLLEPSALADRGGRMTVIVTLADDGVVRWRALRTAERTDHSPYAQEVAVRRTPQTAGLPISATVVYAGDAPARLRVEAASGLPWDVVVVFSD